MYLVVYKCQLNSTYSNQSQCRELMISSKKGDISAACDDPQNRKLAESQATIPYVNTYWYPKPLCFVSNSFCGPFYGRNRVLGFGTKQIVISYLGLRPRYE